MVTATTQPSKELTMTDLDLTGRKALVTGGAQGLGEGMAQALAAAGATVVVADIQDELGAQGRRLARARATASCTST